LDETHNASGTISLRERNGGAAGCQLDSISNQLPKPFTSRNASTARRCSVKLVAENNHAVKSAIRRKFGAASRPQEQQIRDQQRGQQQGHSDGYARKLSRGEQGALTTPQSTCPRT
jgi:hypothetical protein